MSEVTKPIALDESFNTTGQTPKNLADVMKNGLQEIAQAIDSHQGGGGHVILDQNGNALDQEPNMQFVDAHTSDDSVNTTTIIENIKPVTRAQFEVATEDGFYEITDEDDATMEEASADYVEVEGDGTKTYATLLSELYTKIDRAKLSGASYLKIGTDVLAYIGTTGNPNHCFFGLSGIYNNNIYIVSILLKSDGITYQYYDTTAHDLSSRVVTSGAKITLYYGTNSAVTNLINQAKYTYMESGESVQAKFDGLIKTKIISATTSSNGNVDLGLSANNYVVLSVVNNSAGYSSIPFAYNGVWFATIGSSSGSNYVVEVNRTFTLQVYYMEL